MIIRPPSAIASYFTCLATRPPRRRINLLQSLHTLLQYAHLPRHGACGFDRGLQYLDRTDAQLLRDRHHLANYGLLAVLRSHGHHRAHVSPAHRPARRAGNRSIAFSFNPAFDSISRSMAVLTVYDSPTPLFGPDPPLTSVGTTLPAQLGHLAFIFVVKVLFRHAEHAKTFLRGFTPAILHHETFRHFRALRTASSTGDSEHEPMSSGHELWAHTSLAAARSLTCQ